MTFMPGESGVGNKLLREPFSAASVAGDSTSSLYSKPIRLQLNVYKQVTLSSQHLSKILRHIRARLHKIILEYTADKLRCRKMIIARDINRKKEGRKGMESYSGLIGGSELDEGTRGRSFGGWLLSFNSNSELTLKVTLKLHYTLIYVHVTLNNKHQLYKKHKKIIGLKQLCCRETKMCARTCRKVRSPPTRPCRSSDREGRLS